MKEYNEDLRVVRTKKLLSNALIELLQEKKYEELNVSDICDRAMVHRATFYNHFDDKGHLLEFCLEEIQEQIFQQTIKQKNYNDAKEMYLSLISNVIDYINDNKDRINKIMNNNNIDKMKTLISNTLITSARYLISNNKYKEEYPIPEKIIVDYVVGGLTNLGFSWIMSKEHESKENLLLYINTLLNINSSAR